MVDKGILCVYVDAIRFVFNRALLILNVILRSQKEVK